MAFKWLDARNMQIPLMLVVADLPEHVLKEASSVQGASDELQATINMQTQELAVSSGAAINQTLTAQENRVGDNINKTQQAADASKKTTKIFYWKDTRAAVDQMYQEALDDKVDKEVFEVVTQEGAETMIPQIVEKLIAAKTPNLSGDALAKKKTEWGNKLRAKYTCKGPVKFMRFKLEELVPKFISDNVSKPQQVIVLKNLLNKIQRLKAATSGVMKPESGTVEEGIAWSSLKTAMIRAGFVMIDHCDNKTGKKWALSTTLWALVPPPHLNNKATAGDVQSGVPNTRKKASPKRALQVINMNVSAANNVICKVKKNASKNRKVKTVQVYINDTAVNNVIYANAMDGAPANKLMHASVMFDAPAGTGGPPAIETNMSDANITDKIMDGEPPAAIAPVAYCEGVDDFASLLSSENKFQLEAGRLDGHVPFELDAYLTPNHNDFWSFMSDDSGMLGHMPYV
jgi:hypothetical protein